MNRKDIKAGQVYQLCHWQGSPGRPVVFLEDKAATLWEKYRGELAPAADQGRRPCESDGFRAGYGYPALQFKNPSGPGCDVAALAAADPAAELARLRGGRAPSVPGTEWTIVCRMAAVKGPWPGRAS